MQNESSWASIRERIKSYLCNGGLFNPEYMEHDKVRDLLMDISNEIDKNKIEIEELNDLLYSKQGVIDAIDRVLEDARVIHASRALAIKEIIKQRNNLIDEINEITISIPLASERLEQIQRNGVNK